MSSKWSHTRAQHEYRHRQVTDSDLYRIVYHYRDALEHEWESRFESHYGVLREEVKTSLDAYLDCGVLVHGAARVCCSSCNHSILVAFSCKKRGVCSSCGAKRALLFAQNLHENILESVPHRHIVFSIPKRLRVYFRYDRGLHQFLFESAWQSLCDLYRAAAPGIPAAVLSVHTSGDALNHNPHVHGVVADGVFGASGFTPVPKLSSEKLTKLFTHKLLKSLQGRGLVTDTVVAQLLGQAHSGFSAWVGEPIEPEDSNARLFVSRYIDKAPVASSRVSLEGSTVHYLHESEYHPEAQFDPLEFLAALSVQIPNKWEQLTRHYGYYSTRIRGERNKQEHIEPLEQQEVIDKAKASRAWASLIKKVYELDPLLCPKCQAPMKILAFITDSVEISKIMKHLGIPPYRAPPPFENSKQYSDDYFQAA